MERLSKQSHRTLAIQKAIGRRYKIITKIATGGFGDVYLGEHTKLGRKVAIKVLLRSLGEEEDVVMRFQRESRSAANLTHPNIIDIYDVGEGESPEQGARIYYFVMKFIDGEMLAQRMQREKRMSPPEAIHIIKQLADALAYAHGHAVVHRDIKPSNVMLDEYGKPVLMDFGIARFQYAGAVTKEGTMMGTPHYLAPEQPLGKPIDGRTDLYSLGIMSYEMLAGILPFHHENSVQLIFKHINDPPTPLQDLVPGLSPELCGIIHKMLEKTPEKRQQSAGEVVAQLEALSGIYPAPTPAALRRTTPALPVSAQELALQQCFDTARIALEQQNIAAAIENLTNAMHIDSSNDEAQSLFQKAESAMLRQVDQLCNQLNFKEAKQVLDLAKPAFGESAEAKSEEVHKSDQIYQQYLHAKELFDKNNLSDAIRKYQDFLETPPIYDFAVMKELRKHAEDTIKLARVQLESGHPADNSEQDAIAQLPANAGLESIQNQKNTKRSNQVNFLAISGIAALVVAVAVALFYSREDSQTTPGPAPKRAILTANIPEPQKPTVVPVTGSITVRSEPDGATVFLGEQQKGKTPLEITDQPFGTHKIKARLNGFKDIQQELVITPDNPKAEVTITLEAVEKAFGTLIVQSRPPGAMIRVENKAVGMTPKTFPKTAAGIYTLELKKEGYADYNSSVQVHKEQITNLNVQLEEIHKPAADTTLHTEPKTRPGMIVPMGPDVIPPKLISKTDLRYPEAAKDRNLAGTVRLSIFVSETGKIISVKVTASAHPILDEAAKKCVKEWKYEPASRNGIPVSVWTTVSLSFNQQ